MPPTMFRPLSFFFPHVAHLPLFLCVLFSFISLHVSPSPYFLVDLSLPFYKLFSIGFFSLFLILFFFFLLFFVSIDLSLFCRVQMVRVKGFVLTDKLLFKDGRIMFDWWDEIDESKEWQRFIFHLLSASYAVVSIVALIQLCRIQLRVPEYGWTTQKVFHLMNFIVNGLRAVLFGFYKSVFLVKSKALEMVLLDLPGLLFFSTYTLLVLFWAEIYHQARSLPINKLRPAYYSINGFIYFAQACLWISVRLSQSNLAVELSRLFISVISFCAALGFMIYGGRLFFMLRRFPIESRGRQRKLFEVGFVTGICCTCFLIRCIVSTLSADMNAGLDVLDHPILNLVYYMFVEILPSALVLFILRKLPPKRVSEQYHPIR